MEDVKMLETIEDGLSILNSGLIFLLNINQEPVKLIDGHGFTLGVAFKKGFDLGRSFSYCELKPSGETTANSICLLRHRLEQERPKMQIQNAFCLDIV